MPEARTALLRDAGATRELGRILGGALRPGDVLALCGPLGAGKTTLVQGLAEAIGVPPSIAVNSPTFAVCAEYAAPLPLLHVDLYRLDSADEAEAIGLPERLGDPDLLAVVEWADRIPEILPRHTLWLRLEPEEGGRRVSLWEGDAGDVSWIEDAVLPESGGDERWTSTTIQMLADDSSSPSSC